MVVFASGKKATSDACRLCIVAERPASVVPAVATVILLLNPELLFLLSSLVGFSKDNAFSFEYFFHWFYNIW